ncbi:MAG: ParB/RepB/Spo0J family partition protein [Candidatus Omnitrophica bacterium]|nr:ParB/RepB/Spo0J family partition protein [Candidatus Omnitrophota bacterium]
MENRALGKGLSALIPENKDVQTEESVIYLKAESIKFNQNQPRSIYDNEKLNELKASIKEKGILQPILVRKSNGSYEVIAGERRLRAAKALNMTQIPALVKNVNDQEALVIALVENIQREELNPMEEAMAYRKLIEDFSYTQDVVAKAVGKNRSTVTNLLRLLKLPKEIQGAISKGQLSVGHARALLALESFVDKKAIFDEILKKNLSVREVELFVQRKNQKLLRPAKRVPQKDSDILHLEDDLQKSLGTKVSIVSNKKKKGKIVIEYYSLDDLDRILTRIKA